PGALPTDRGPGRGSRPRRRTAGSSPSPSRPRAPGRSLPTRCVDDTEPDHGCASHSLSARERRVLDRVPSFTFQQARPAVLNAPHEHKGARLWAGPKCVRAPGALSVGAGGMRRVKRSYSLATQCTGGPVLDTVRPASADGISGASHAARLALTRSPPLRWRGWKP